MSPAELDRNDRLLTHAVVGWAIGSFLAIGVLITGVIWTSTMQHQDAIATIFTLLPVIFILCVIGMPVGYLVGRWRETGRDDIELSPRRGMRP